MVFEVTDVERYRMMRSWRPTSWTASCLELRTSSEALVVIVMVRLSGMLVDLGYSSMLCLAEGRQSHVQHLVDSGEDFDDGVAGLEMAGSISAIDIVHVVLSLSPTSSLTSCLRLRSANFGLPLGVAYHGPLVSA